MKIKNLWYKTGAVLLLIIGMASCQDDLNTIGSEILGSEDPVGTLDDSFTLTAYNKKMNPVQSNRLPASLLGAYKHPTFGRSKVNLLSQLTLQSGNPKFGDSAKVDSVFVYLPYYSTETVVDSTYRYTTDSVYGNEPIGLRIFESKYYLREYDPNTGFEEFQPYYSNQGELFESHLGQELAYVESFTPSSQGFEFVSPDDEDEVERLGPGLRISLDSDFFQERILDKEGSEELRNNTNFKDYFRGLYFQVESDSGNGSLFLFDYLEANVMVYYSYLPEDSQTRKSDKIDFGFRGVSVNTFENDPLPQQIQSALENADEENGDENLYLKGGDGIMTVINLFGKDEDDDGVPEELELLRAKKWLINEANLIFYVNQDLLSGGKSEPERILIYDLRNNRVLVDYNNDPTAGLPPEEAVVNHLGKLERGSDEKGKYYKIKITDHISNIINKDSVNSPLGLVVSHNVNNRFFQKLSEEQAPVEMIPAGSVISPKGTILHGNKSPNEEKRLKLQIYYTEPN